MEHETPNVDGEPTKPRLTSEDIRARVHGVLESHRVNLEAIYCSATGDVMGLSTQLEMINWDDNNDSLVYAHLLSARPAPQWIRRQKASYRIARDCNPYGLTVYLISIIFDALEAANKSKSAEGSTLVSRWISSQAHAEFIRKKIVMNQNLRQSLSADVVTKAADALLELDARRGLNTIAPAHGMSFDDFLDPEQFTKHLAALLTHCESELEQARIQSARSGSYWARNATGLSFDRDNPKVTPEKSERDLAIEDAVLDALTAAGLGDYREAQGDLEQAFAVTPRAPIATHGAPSKPMTTTALKKLRVLHAQSDITEKPRPPRMTPQDELRRRIAEFDAQHLTSAVSTLGKLKI